MMGFQKMWDYKNNKYSRPILVNSESPKSYYFICSICHTSFYGRVCDVSKSNSCPSCVNRKNKSKESLYIDIEVIKRLFTPRVIFYIILVIALTIIIALLFKIYFTLVGLYPI